MSITFTPDPQSGVELAVGIESTYGSIATPTVQIGIVEAPDFGQGHQRIQGDCLTSTIQDVITHWAVLGLQIPYVGFTVPLSPNNISTLFHMVLGGALGSVAANTWPIVADPSGFTVGLNVQRPDFDGSRDYFKFLGFRVGSCRIFMPIGGMPTMRLEGLARQMLFPDTAPTTFPNLAPTTSARPNIITDCTLKHAATVGAISGSTAVKFRGFELGIDIPLHVEHNSTALHPDSIVRAGFHVEGSFAGHFSKEWWDEWKSLIPDDDTPAGYSLRYLEFLLAQTGGTLRLRIPSRLEQPGIRRDQLALDAPISFAGAGDDTAGAGGVPTTPAILATTV